MQQRALIESLAGSLGLDEDTFILGERQPFNTGANLFVVGAASTLLVVNFVNLPTLKPNEALILEQVGGAFTAQDATGLMVVGAVVAQILDATPSVLLNFQVIAPSSYTFAAASGDAFGFSLVQPPIFRAKDTRKPGTGGPILSGGAAVPPFTLQVAASVRNPQAAAHNVSCQFSGFWRVLTGVPV